MAGHPVIWISENPTKNSVVGTSASGQISARNSAAAAFPRPSTPWGTWTYSAIHTAASSGEPVYIKALTEAVEIKRGYMPTIAEGAVEVGLN